MNNSLPVWLYLPNIIGYFRFVLIVLGFCIALDFPILSCLVLVSACLLDMLDGFVARVYKQTSRLGAMLDYTLDRIMMVGFCFLLAILYPQFWLIFMFCATLDVASHLFHLNASLVQNKTSHKEMTGEKSFLLRLYYCSRLNLTMICLTHDCFLMFCYLYVFYPGPIIFSLLIVSSLGFVLKTLIHIAQFVRAFESLSQEGKRENNAVK